MVPHREDLSIRGQSARLNSQPKGLRGQSEGLSVWKARQKVKRPGIRYERLAGGSERPASASESQPEGHAGLSGGVQ